MREKIQQYKNQLLETWQGISRKQKGVIIGSFSGIVLLLVLVIYWGSRPDFVPLYNNLSQAEAGEIVSAIESRGIPVELSPDGTTISVPREEASRLKVELASEGIPKSGNIDYSIFSENMGWGTTDRQLDVVERDAMQNELSRLIEQIEGIDRAQVMITLPKESVWLADEEQTATASVVIHTRQNLDQSQINGLYHLISKSIPQLPVENIVLMNQYMQPLEMTSEETAGNNLAVHQQQREIKRSIEQDIQRELQRMLGSMFGMDNVVVSVFAHVDFTQETREEQLVEPVVDDEGIEISIERIQEIYEGQGQPPGGVAGTGETEVAGYQGAAGGENSEYERIEERINREVNRIHRQIVSSPYTVTDLSINVGLDESIAVPEVEAAVQDLLGAIIQTSLGEAAAEWDEAQLEERITVFTQSFPDQEMAVTDGIDNWLVYALAAALVLVIIILIIVLLRRRRNTDEYEDLSPSFQEPEKDLLTALEDDQSSKRKQIEQLAKERPKEFVALLKSWMVED
jgi:flagellar M-ring protein FliF